MIGCLRTRVRKQPIIALYFESKTVLKFYNLEARSYHDLEEYVRRPLIWNETIEKGLMVNADKTKIMICDTGLDLLQRLGT